MDEKKKIERERLLLVEGKTDKEFFDRLCMNQLGDDYVTNLQILPYDGKDSLKSFLEVLLTLPKFEEVTHLGIVRDADFTGGALASIQGILRQLPQLQQYSNSNNFSSGRICTTQSSKGVAHAADAGCNKQGLSNNPNKQPIIIP